MFNATLTYAQTVLAQQDKGIDVAAFMEGLATYFEILPTEAYAAGISYSDDIDKAEAVLLDILDKHEKVLDNPEPVVKVHELGESSVNFVVRPWVKTDDYWETYWALTKEVKQRFDKEGISIPFPQRDVHVREKKPV